MSLWQRTDVAGKLPKYLPVGQIVKINVTNGGTGYTDGSAVAVTIGAPGAGGVQATATAVVSGGVVQSINITNPGTLYSSNPTVTMATGNGLAVSIVREGIKYDPTKIVFVDRTEASAASNKSKGINTPGWWHIVEFTDDNGDKRYKSECLVVISSSGSAVGDTGDASDDLIVPDATVTAAISVQPTDQTAVDGEATFSVTAALTPTGTVTYQWQVAAVGSNKYTAINGETSATLALTGLTEADNGKKYRVVVGGAGAKTINSTAAVLTVEAEE
jgi:hypothetical protein